MTGKNNTDPPLLTTARLQLRSISKADSDDLYAIYSDMKTPNLFIYTD